MRLTAELFVRRAELFLQFPYNGVEVFVHGIFKTWQVFGNLPGVSVIYPFTGSASF
jgi:hypothetical protein